MKNLSTILFGFALALQVSVASAATCFWVGGTGTFSTSNTASWSSSSGGTGGTCAGTGGVPKQAADTATFDALSGGGTVTVDSTINGISLTALTAGSFTGTLDFSANNPSITFSGTFSLSGTGTRTINLGSGTFTFTGSNATTLDVSVSSNMTLTATSATFVWSATGTGSQGVNLGTNQSYGTFNINGRTGGSRVALTVNSTATTIASLNFTGPVSVNMSAAVTYNVTSLSVSGTSSTAVSLNGNGNTTVSLGGTTTITGASLAGLIITTNSLTANNSFNAGGNSGLITINPPTGGGNKIIGG